MYYSKVRCTFVCNTKVGLSIIFESIFVSIIFESIYYESTTTTVLPADVHSYFPKVRMYNYFISYENTFESNVVCTPVQCTHTFVQLTVLPDTFAFSFN